MKKYILFILLLLVPFIVKAQDVKIKDISLVDSTNDLEVEEKQISLTHEENENRTQNILRLKI